MNEVILKKFTKLIFTPSKINKINYWNNFIKAYVKFLTILILTLSKNIKKYDWNIFIKMNKVIM